MRHPVTVVILAGGAASRMGTDKMAITLGDRSVIDHVIAAAEPWPTLVVGRRLPGVRSIPDPTPDHRGPLAGLVAALDATVGPIVLVGGDQPWLRTATISALAASADPTTPVAPIDDTVRQVLCALYPPGVAAAARRILDLGGGIQRLMDTEGVAAVEPATWATWGEDGRSWFSIDTPADLDAGMARYGLPGRQTG